MGLSSSITTQFSKLPLDGESCDSPSYAVPTLCNHDNDNCQFSIQIIFLVTLLVELQITEISYQEIVRATTRCPSQIPTNLYQSLVVFF
jgi:hypothetical protein